MNSEERDGCKSVFNDNKIKHRCTAVPLQVSTEPLSIKGKRSGKDLSLCASKIIKSFDRPLGLNKIGS